MIAAVHPTLIYAATHVQVAGLGATLLVWTLAWAYRTGASGRPGHAAITGGFLALLVLSDPILSLAMIGVAWALWQGCRGEAGGWRRFATLTLLTMGVGLLGVSPWLVRNYRLHGEFVAIKSTFGYAFWQGNCDLSEGTDKVRRASVEGALRDGPNTLNLSGLNRALWVARHEAGYIDDIALTRADKTRLGLRSRSPSGRGSCSAGRCPSWRPTPGDTPSSASGGCSTSSSSTRRIPSRGRCCIGCRTSG